MRACQVRAAVVLSVGMLWSSAARAKDFGIQTPSGRRTYLTDEHFSELVDHKQRILVSEVAIGSGPEGNLAILLGWLNIPVRRLDLYAGFGVEANPAMQWTLAGRYGFNFGGFRPYASLGYLHKDTYAVGVVSHNAFLELGHTWVLHRTYRLSVGAGLRRVLSRSVSSDSLLDAPDTDRALLAQELDAADVWIPLVALRFSRAF